MLTIGLSTAAAVWWAQGAAARSAEWQQGQKAYQEGNYAEAAKQYNKVLETYPDNADLLTDLGRSYQQWGESDGKKFDFALNAYERAHAVRPDGRLSACMAYCWQRLGKTELAGHNLDAAQQQGFASAGFYNNLAYFYLKNGNKCDQAIEHLDKAISANGELRAAYHNRALAYVQKVIMSGGLNPPINKGPTTWPPCARRQAASRSSSVRFASAIKSALRDLRGGGSLEGFRDAARIWGLCTAYDPGDADQALTYLERAAKLGLAPSVLREDAVLQPLSGHERFQKLLTGQVAVQPTVPTTRIVDPWQQ